MQPQHTPGLLHVQPSNNFLKFWFRQVIARCPEARARGKPELDLFASKIR
jgi:hypothetical protein